MIQNKKRKKICMIVPEMNVCGGIAAVTSGYRGSRLEEDYDIVYVESYRDGNKFQKFIKAIRAYFRFIHVLNTDDIDLIHIHSSFGPSFYRKLPFINIAYRRHIPVINHIHGSDFDGLYAQASDRKKKLVRKTYNKCAAIIALADEWKKRLSLVVPPEKINVIPNYSQLHPEVVENRTIKTGGPVNILYLGLLIPAKGVYEIIEVASKLAGKTDLSLKFILAGVGEEAEVAKLKEKIKEYNLDDNIEFTGWIRGEEKDKRLKEADIFFLPSHNECFPMSILEASGYGVPTVASDVGGIPQIVRNGETGILCPPKDIEAFTQALFELIEDPDKRFKMGKAAYKFADGNYSLDSHIDRIEKLWEKVLNGR